MNPLLKDLFFTKEMAEIFSVRAQVQSVLNFEIALLHASATAGFVPEASAGVIIAKCDADAFPLMAIAAAMARARDPALPVLQQLTALVALDDEAASRFVQSGVAGTAAGEMGLMLQVRAALKLLSTRLEVLSAALADLAQRHRETQMVGRTLLQHALPITFGLKAAGWLSAIERHRARLLDTAAHACVLQLEGAAGKPHPFGDGEALVVRLLAEKLQLEASQVPRSEHRDRMCRIGCVLASLTGTLGKVARDVALLMQTEVAEAFELRRENDSSTLPQKHNPMAAAAILAAAHQTPGLAATLLSSLAQERSSAPGAWSAGWIVLSELFQLTDGAVERALQMIAGLKIDHSRMRENLAMTRGTILAEAITMALGRRRGRLEAHELVRQACKRADLEHQSLRVILEKTPEVSGVLGAEELDRLFDPTNYVGLSAVFVDRVLDRWRSGVG